MANKGNVTVGKPLIAGAVYRAPVGTTLPTAAGVMLDEAFAPVGYISDEGLRWSYSGDGDVIRAWGRDVVARPAGAVDDVASFQMLETVNEEAVKAFWGDDARRVISGGYALQVGVPSPVQYSWVIDMVLPIPQDNDAVYFTPSVRRIVIPAASVRERDEISYQDSELVAYGLSLKASKDSTGKHHHEYVERFVLWKLIDQPSDISINEETYITVDSSGAQSQGGLFSDYYVYVEQQIESSWNRVQSMNPVTTAEPLSIYFPEQGTQAEPGLYRFHLYFPQTAERVSKKDLYSTVFEVRA